MDADIAAAGTLRAPEALASSLLARSSRIIPYLAAAITYLPSGGCGHRVFVNEGYDDVVADYLATDHVRDRSFEIIRRAAGTPLFWCDIPDVDSTTVVRDVLRLAGYLEGSSVVLRAEGNRVTSVLHVSFGGGVVAAEMAPLVASLARSCEQVLEDQRQLESFRLSPRETQILTLVARGDSNADIAAALQVSRRTVATHLENIFAKMGTRSRVRAAVHATRLGIL